MTRDQTLGRGRCEFFFVFFLLKYLKRLRVLKFWFHWELKCILKKIVSQDTKCSLINLSFKILEATNLVKLFIDFHMLKGEHLPPLFAQKGSLLPSTVPRNLGSLPRLRDRAVTFLFAGSTSSEFSRITSTHTFVNSWVPAQTLWLRCTPAQTPAPLTHPRDFYSPADPAQCLQQTCSSHTLVPRAQRPTAQHRPCQHLRPKPPILHQVQLKISLWTYTSDTQFWDEAVGTRNAGFFRSLTHAGPFSSCFFWDTHNSCPSTWSLKTTYSLQLLTWRPHWLQELTQQPSWNLTPVFGITFHSHTELTSRWYWVLAGHTHGIESEITQRES